jgi:hypothetical protein
LKPVSTLEAKLRRSQNQSGLNPDKARLRDERGYSRKGSYTQGFALFQFVFGFKFVFFNNF